MSKVVHLSDQAHHRAKAFCQKSGMKMSEWVAQLIDHAVVDGPIGASNSSHDAAPEATRALAAEATAPTPQDVQMAGLHGGTEGQNFEVSVPRKKKLVAAPAPVMHEESLPIYEAPPFWAR